jgi:hypothetical protein
MELPVAEAPLRTRTATGRTLDGRRIEDIVAPPRPLLRPAPRSAMFFPLVVVVAVLPGLYALSCWDLSPPGPWWGLRGLAVLDGLWLDQVPLGGLGPPGEAGEAAAYRAVAFQPPLYAWLEAACLAVSSHRNPLASALPSYVLGALVVVLAYLHGRLWRGRGVGLAVAVLTAFHRELLMQMQQASPVTLALAGALGTLLCYAESQRDAEGRSWVWIVSSGVCLGLSLLAVGLFGLVVLPVIGLHRLLLSGGGGASAARRAPRRRRWLGVGTRAGLAALAIALVVALPWHLHMAARYGDAWLGALAAPGASVGAGPAAGLASTLLALAPATLPLALLAAARAGRRLLAEDGPAGALAGDAFCLAWLAVASLLPGLWPSGPRALINLFLLVPLNLLAAQAVDDLASRRLPARNLVWLAPATAISVAWWLSADLRAALSVVWHGERPDAATLLGLHLGLDLILVLALLTGRLDRWARRRDTRRRFVLGLYLAAVAAVTVGMGLREVGFRHRETAELLDLRRAILRREKARPFWMIAAVGPDAATLPGIAGPPGGRLRFVLRATLPHLSQLDLARPEDLLALAHPEPPGTQRLVVLVGNERPLPYRQQSQLNLEAIYTSDTGLLQAFATTTTPARRARR